MSAPVVEERVPVAVLGATGIVGQHLVRRLEGHPSLRLAELVGSAARAGRRYGATVEWCVSDEMPQAAREIELLDLRGAALSSPIVLSALPARAAATLEPMLARAGHLVCTNASAHRMEATVPLIVPEVNGRAVDLVASQEWAASGGALVANPNCVVAGLALALAPIERTWGVHSGAIVTLQSLSGAGSAGPSALSMAGNVVPWIEGEEAKIESELRKVLGADFSLAVAVNRVPVVDGHSAHVFLNLRRRAHPEEVLRELRSFTARDTLGTLPSLPSRPLVVRDEPDRPQPRLDAMAGDGMTVSVGRIRHAPPFDVALTIVVNNVVRGAAGACLLNAELCLARGLLGNTVC